MPRPNDVFSTLPESTSESSKTTINIAGFHVHLYGFSELTPEQAKDTIVLFHIHGRTRTYKDAEAFAHQILHQLRQRGGYKKGLVVATFDNRNHGSRAIDTNAINGWNNGNSRHAQDMLSMMDGIVRDVQTVMTFLESYVDSIFTPSQFIITGLSLGGHVSWDLLARDPRVNAAVIIVGCPDLTTMILDRLGGYSLPTDVPAGTAEWPKSVERLYLARDREVAGICRKQLLVLNGADDPLVPSRFTRPWIEKYAANNDVIFVEQPETGHCLSYEMLQMIEDWLQQFLN